MPTVLVAPDGAVTKFWLDPEVILASNRGFTTEDFRDVPEIIEAELPTLRAVWDDFFNP